MPSSLVYSPGEDQQPLSAEEAAAIPVHPDFSFEFPWPNDPAGPVSSWKRLWSTLHRLHERAFQDARHDHRDHYPMEIWATETTLFAHAFAVARDTTKFNLDALDLSKSLTNNKILFIYFYSLFYAGAYLLLLREQNHTTAQTEMLARMERKLLTYTTPLQPEHLVLARQLLEQLPQYQAILAQEFAHENY